jgi:2-polyprenyl-3-methyl-5-hydroxy-6-metoxy-1,4-benzoquinol methylase
MENLSHLELVACNLCGGDDFDVVFNSPHRVPAGDQMAAFVASTDRFDRYGQIVKCRGCGLVYTNPRPLPSGIRQGYRTTVDPEYAEEDSSRSINAHLSLHTLRRFAKKGRLLDVGCATGFFLNAARLDFETIGIEPSEWAADYARTRLRLDVLTGNLEEVAIESGSFDVVTLIDVIEHVTDPKAALQRVSGLLKPGGWLYLVTPDIGSLSARLLRGRWWGLRPAHLYYFSQATLRSMLQAAGLHVELLAPYGRIFTYRYWLSRLKSYPSVVHRTVARFVRAFGVEDKFLYLNTRDSMEVCARKM